MSSLRSLLLNTKPGGYAGDLNYVGLEAIDSNGAVLMAEGLKAEINQLSMNINQLSYIHCGLEDVRETVEASLDEGGLDRAGAALVVSSARALMLPLEHTLPMPGLERFGGRGERIGSTRIALEALQDKINQIWEAIKKAFENLRAKVTNWYKAIFDSVTKIKNRAEKIIEEAKKIDKSPEKDSFDFIIEKISKDGKTVDDLGKDMDGLITMARTVLGSLYNNLTSKASNSFSNAIQGLSVKTPDDIVKGMTSCYQVVDSFNSLLKGLPMGVGPSPLPANFADNKAFQSTDEVEFFQGMILPGNKAFYYGQPKAVQGAGQEGIGMEDEPDGETDEQKAARLAKEKELADAANAQQNKVEFTPEQKTLMGGISKYFSLVNKMGYQLSEANEDETFDKDKVDVKTPTALTIESLAKKVIALIEPVDKFKETADKISETKSNLLKKGDNLAKKVGENKIMAAEKDLFSLVGLPKDVANVIDGPGDEIVSLSVTLSNLVLNYCQAALACYK